MKKAYWIIGLLLNITQLVNAGGGPDYNVLNIPEDLRKHTNAVKRQEEIRFELTDVGHARLYETVAITVFNAKGDKYAAMNEYYDQLQSIESIDGALYDGLGKKLKSLKKSEIMDVSATESGTFVSDTRRKSHNFYYRAYPYTVEYEVELKLNSTMFFPRWVPVEDDNYSVQESKLTVVCPQGYTLRYKAMNYPGEPVMATEKSRKTYTWEVKNIPALEWEYARPQWNEITPEVYLGPSQFQIEGYSGNMQSWQDYGKFVYALKSGRDELPPAVKQKVHELVNGVTDQKEKIRRLYEYLQANTHYVGIQLGIGGWQPFDATYVAEKKYGDCKALANFMYALLKEAGIKSYYTLILAGQNRKFMLVDFPSSQFNHVIVCVPGQQDSTWLECTSQTLPAGYLSSFTEDRYALLIDENGGTLVRTPKYHLSDNLQTRHITGSINEQGDLTAAIKTRYRAIQQDDLESLINGLSKDKVMEYLKSEIPLPTYDIARFDYQENKSPIPSIDETLELNATAYAQVSGRRLFIVPNVLSRSRTRLETEEQRKFDIALSSEWRDIDTVEVTIPSGYLVESLPADQNLSTKFGSYKTTTRVEGNKITYYRIREQYSGKFPAKDYPDLVAYFEKIYKSDQAQVVLVKGN